MENYIANYPATDLIAKYTKLFADSMLYVKLRTIFLMMTRIYILVSMFTLYFIQLSDSGCQSTILTKWLLVSAIQAIFSTILYGQVFMLALDDKIVENQAFHFHQILYVPKSQCNDSPQLPEFLDPSVQLSTQEFNKKSDILQMQIRSEIVLASKLAKYNNMFSNATVQLIFIWTVYNLYVATENQDTCQEWAVIQVYLYSVMLFIQYGSYYFIAAILVAVSPFILAFMIVRYFKQRKERTKCLRALNDLQLNLKKYEPNIVRGEQECSICMQAYERDDEILELPCNEMHHFHNTCISAWLNLQTSCPICRKQIFEIEQRVLL